ncbi:MAG: hypothetical protein LQ352_001604 [Teloschistes flavicans]|nr:MAG: hypothetical protein LQ352_001604 [Teloschistes flavicans]
MLSIQPSSAKPSSSKYIPNLLPCQIHHDGPVNASSRYWDPQENKDGESESYFRGRKLKGRAVKLPEGYRGVVVKDGVKEVEQKGNVERLSRRDQEDGNDDEEEEEEDVGVLEEMGEFEEVVVWGHERTVGADDEVVKGVEEWISFAEAIHGPGLLQGQGDVQTKQS